MAKRWIYMVIFVSFALKVFLVSHFNTPGKVETFEYETIADNILNGKGFVYMFFGVPHKAFIQPFYPVFSALIYYLTNHSQTAMILIQCLISSLLALVVYSLAMRFTGAKEALLAATLTAFHPALTVYSIFKLHPLVFDVFLYLSATVLILKFIQGPTAKGAYLTGIVIGLALLSRITILPFAIFLMLYIFILKDLKIKTRLKYFLIMGLSALVIYSPWIIRNYRVFHRFVFMPTCVGENLWVGNNYSASGSAILVSGQSVHTAMPEKIRSELSRLDELAQVKYYSDYFLNFLKGHPILFFKLFLKKLYYFWWFSTQAGTLYPRLWLIVYKVYYFIIVLFAIMGAFWHYKEKKNYRSLSILYIYMLSIAFIHAAANLDTRHRWIIEPIILIFSATGFVNAIRYFKRCLLKNA